MANTTPMGRIAPASKSRTGNTPHFDPVALHGEAINACAMATYYTRKGNHAGAARKAVQALGALRRLQSVAAKAPASPCTNCRDNFPLPEAADVFDSMVIAGYVVVEPRLDVASKSAWYLVAGNQSALEYGYLDGTQGVQITQREGFEIDGLEVKARLDFGCGWVAPVGWVKSSGTVD